MAILKINGIEKEANEIIYKGNSLNELQLNGTKVWAKLSYTEEDYALAAHYQPYIDANPDGFGVANFFNKYKGDFEFTQLTRENWNFVGLLDTSKVTSMYTTFSYARAMERIPSFSLENVGWAGSIFDNCSALKEFPPIDFSNVTHLRRSFAGCTSLASVPAEIDLPNCADVAYMFYGAAITVVPKLNFGPNIESIGFLFSATRIRIVPEFKVQANPENNPVGTSIFKSCTALEEASNIDLTEYANYYTDMFQNCTSLRTVTNLKINKDSIVTNMFSNCPALEKIRIITETSPPSLGSGVLLGAEYSVIIEVPNAVLVNYTHANIWKNYNIVGYDPE